MQSALGSFTPVSCIHSPAHPTLPASLSSPPLNVTQ